MEVGQGPNRGCSAKGGGGNNVLSGYQHFEAVGLCIYSQTASHDKRVSTFWMNIVLPSSSRTLNKMNLNRYVYFKLYTTTITGHRGPVPSWLGLPLLPGVSEAAAVALCCLGSPPRTNLR
jgi:hypothetical protein